MPFQSTCLQYPGKVYWNFNMLYTKNLQIRKNILWLLWMRTCACSSANSPTTAAYGKASVARKSLWIVFSKCLRVSFHIRSSWTASTHPWGSHSYFKWFASRLHMMTICNNGSSGLPSPADSADTNSGCVSLNTYAYLTRSVLWILLHKIFKNHIYRIYYSIKYLY